MRKNYLLYAQICVLLMLIILSLIFIPDNAKLSAKSLNDCTPYLTGWTLSTNSTSYEYDVLPTFLNTTNERDAYISRTLNDIKDGDCIGFFSFQQQITVSLDGVKIYEFVPEPDMKSSTPGNRWNYLPLSKEYNGKELSIHIYQCYSNNRITLPSFFYGSQAGIIISYLRLELPQFMISALMVLFGIGLCTFCILYRKKSGSEQGLKWLAMFAIFRGLWTAIEANIYSIFFTRYLLFSRVSYMCLKLSVITYIQFINMSFHNGRSKTFKILFILSYADFWITSFCQMILGIDFATTIYFTHSILLIGAVLSFVSSLRALHNAILSYNIAPDKTQLNSYIAQAVATLAIIITSVIDLVRYYVTSSPDISRYSRWGDIIYIATTSIIMLLDFIGLVRIGHKAKQIKEEASLDPLTKLMNRYSFEHDISSVSKRQLKNKSIVMLDLNNLKYFNDVHGHGMGDYYIIIASEIIKDAFCKWGEVYRIGGDEFCVIAKNLTQETFDETRKNIEEHMQKLKMPNQDLHMGISAGYAAFNTSLDRSLRDTMKRADEFMYKRKMELKQQNKNHL